MAPTPAFPQLYNTETRQPEDVPEQDIEQAVVSGTHSYQTGAKVNVVGPDGSVGNVPAEDLKDFLTQGYKIETPSLRAFNESVEAESGVAGQAKTLARNLANTATFGVLDPVLDKIQDPLDVARRAAIDKQNSTAATIGSLGGLMLGPETLIGKGLFRGAAAAGNATEKALATTLAKAGIDGSKNIATKILKNTAERTAKYGAEGLVIAAPEATTEAILGDPEAAGETLLAGGAIGSAFGVGAGVLKKAANVASDLAEQAPGLASSGLKALERNQTAHATGFTKRFFNEPKPGKFSETALGADRINQISDYLQEKNLIKVGESPEAFRDKLSGIADDLQTKVEGTFKTFDDNGIRTFDPLAVKKEVRSQLADRFSGNILTPGTGGQLNRVYKILDKFAERAFETEGEGDALFGKDARALSEPDNAGTSSAIKFSDAAELKQQLVDAMTQFPNSTVYNRTVGIVSAALKKAGDEAVPLLKGKIPDAEVEQISKLKQQQGMILDALKGANEKVAQVGGNKLLGPSSLAGGIGGSIVGGSLGGVAGVVANKARMAYGDQALSVGLNRLQRAMGMQGAKINFLADSIKTGKNFIASKMPDSLQSINALQALLGQDYYAKDKIQALNDLRDKTGALIGNPEAMSNVIANQLGDLPSKMPEVANAFAASYTNALTYLHDQIPKPPNSPSLFDTKAPWQPSDREIAAFERKAQIVLDPMSIIKEISDNTLTKEHVMALQAVYPKLYESIQKKIYATLSNGEPNNIPYSRRMKLSQLMGTAIEPSLNANRVKTMQQNFIPDKKPEQPRANSKLTIGQSTQTDFSRAENG